MTIFENYVVYPDGDSQEVDERLDIDELVDLNGRPLALPLPTLRIIAYRVVKIRHSEERGVYSVYHYLELVPAAELASYCR